MAIVNSEEIGRYNIQQEIVSSVEAMFCKASENARKTIRMRRALNAAASTVRWWLHGAPGQYGAHGDDIIINYEITTTLRNRINE